MTLRLRFIAGRYAIARRPRQFNSRLGLSPDNRPFDFQAAGIVHSLITPLSTHGIGVFVVCTFDGEHVLVAESDRIKARDLLLAAGHEFSD